MPPWSPSTCVLSFSLSSLYKILKQKKSSSSSSFFQLKYFIIQKVDRDMRSFPFLAVNVSPNSDPSNAFRLNDFSAIIFIITLTLLRIFFFSLFFSTIVICNRPAGEREPITCISTLLFPTPSPRFPDLITRCFDTVGTRASSSQQQVASML